MASGKRASMREGPLAALFRKTDEAQETAAAQPPPVEPAREPEPEAVRPSRRSRPRRACPRRRSASAMPSRRTCRTT